MKLYITEKGTADCAKTVVAEDMILTKELPTTAGSKMLEGYESLFDAEVVTRLKEAGFVVDAKANVGEMGIDFLGETSYFGACIDENGKLVSASAKILEKAEAKAVIALDVNGAPRRAAALSGKVFIKPTYGVVSRYGTIPAACSGETVGVMAEKAGTCREILSVISGHDDKDGTSLSEEKCELVKQSSGKQIKKIAVAKALYDMASKEVAEDLDRFVEKAKAKGICVEEIDAKELLLAKPAWCVLMSAEVCNNVSRYDGVKYGHRCEKYTNIDELYTGSRTEGFGFNLKKTILYGSETLSDENYMRVYDKALRIRRVLCEYLTELFKSYDAVVMPACTNKSYDYEKVKAQKDIAYDESVYTSVASITGLPAIVCEGVQLIANAFDDSALLELAEKI